MNAVLPEVTPLLSLPPEVWRSLGRRLDVIGLDNIALANFARLAGKAESLRRWPLAKWHARRLVEPLGYALRMFVLEDGVTSDEARDALGSEISLDQLLEVGVLRSNGDGTISSPFAMCFLQAERCIRLLCDDLLTGGDAVMGASSGTFTLLEMAFPTTPVGRVLDLGCGAGSVALMLAATCERVVATDVNPRAIALARVNAWINGIENVEFRLGDMFAPVAGETFDVIASQPPFVSRPPDAPPATFLYGGSRGDELPIQVLRQLPGYLTPHGAGFIMIEWLEITGDAPIERRVREAVGPGMDLLILRKRSLRLDEHCLEYAKVGSPEGAYERLVLDYRDHLAGQSVEALVTDYIVARRTVDEGGWTAVLPWQEHFAENGPTRPRVDELLARNDLASRRPHSGQSDSSNVSAALLLAMAEQASLTGSPGDALALFGHICGRDPTCAAAIIGAARIEIANGQAEAAVARLAELVPLGDREARRLLGDIDWAHGQFDAALARYAVEPRPDVLAPSSVSPCPVENKIEVRRRARQNRPFLVWVTCPTLQDTVVSRWFQPGRPRRWDLAVNCFAPHAADVLIGHADHLILGGPSKLSSVKASLLTDPKLFEGYRAMLFLDDDMGFRHDDVDKLFWLMARYQLDLAHPSLSDDSSCPVAPMFRQRESAMRFTSAVDVRAPCFSRAGFVTCVDSFDQAISGRGLGHVWSHLLRYGRHAIGVLDEIVAHHLRPIDPVGGSFYRHLGALGVDPPQEMQRVFARYGCVPTHPRTIGDVDRHGRERHFST